jgi:hypothetical protein
MLNDILDRPLVLEGDPLIYSVKCPAGQRTRGLQYFRNKQWKPFLTTHFRSLRSQDVPVVVLLKFFIKPPEGVKVPKAALSQESAPAVKPFELCEYILSFLEMIRGVLITAYKQIVKIDAVKLYSDNPRLEVKIMRWNEYVNMQNNNSNDTKAESLGKDESRPGVQSKLGGHGKSHKARKGTVSGQADAALEGAVAGDSALSDASSGSSPHQKKRSAKLPTSHKETRRR